MLTSFTVAPVSYLKFVFKVRKVVSGSIITALIEATAYCLRLFLILSFVVTVKFEPDFALIEI